MVLFIERSGSVPSIIDPSCVPPVFPYDSPAPFWLLLVRAHTNTHVRLGWTSVCRWCWRSNQELSLERSGVLAFWRNLDQSAVKKKKKKREKEALIVVVLRVVTRYAGTPPPSHTVSGLNDSSVSIYVNTKTDGCLQWVTSTRGCCTFCWVE